MANHFAIVDVKRHTTLGQVGGKMLHNERLRDAPNADPERKHLNERLTDLDDSGRSASTAVVDAVKARLDTVERTIRQDAVRVVEYEITVSNGHFDPNDHDAIRAWAERSLEWVKERHGAENVVYAGLHLDETTPNLHVMVVPLTPDGRLSAKEVLGGKAQMRAMHTSYAQAVAMFGLERGQEFSQAKHQDLDRWYAERQTEQRQAQEIAQGIDPTGTHTRQIAQAIETERQRRRDVEEQATQLKNQLHGKEYSDRTQARYAQRGRTFEALREIDLEAVAAELGGQRTREQHVWEIGGKEIRIVGQQYYDFKTDDPAGKRGGAIDLTMYATGWDFKRTVEYLEDRFYRRPDEPARVQPRTQPAPARAPDEATEYQHPPRFDRGWPQVRDYLTRVRGIPAEIVDQAHEAGSVYATRSPQGYVNAVFVRAASHDKDGQPGEPTGAYMRGLITARKFEKMQDDTKREKGFFAIPFGDQNARHFERESLVIVESPIDAMSYKALKQNTRAHGWIVSTDGNGPLPLEMMNETLERGGKVRGAFDNDEGGTLLWRKLAKEHPDRVSGEYKTVTRELPTGKDWNEDLGRSLGLIGRFMRDGFEKGPGPGPLKGGNILSRGPQMDPVTSDDAPPGLDPEFTPNRGMGPEMSH